MRVGLSSKRYFKKTVYVFLTVAVIILLAEVVERVEINFLSSAEQYVSIQASQIIDRCVSEEFCKINPGLLQTFGEDSVVTDTVAINKLRSQMMLSIQNSLEDELAGTVYVPLGTILEPSVFHSVGPDVPIKIRPGGFVTSEIEEDFEAVGINQVKYSMYLTVKVEVRYTGLFLQSELFVNTRVPVIENISIGDVPDYYGDMGILD